MGEPVVDKNTPGKREYLRFILQTPERGGEDDPVVIALKYGTDIIIFLKNPILEAEPAVGDQSIPIYHVNFIFLTYFQLIKFEALFLAEVSICGEQIILIRP